MSYVPTRGVTLYRDSYQLAYISDCFVTQCDEVTPDGIIELGHH